MLTQVWSMEMVTWELREWLSSSILMSVMKSVRVWAWNSLTCQRLNYKLFMTIMPPVYVAFIAGADAGPLYDVCLYACLVHQVTVLFYCFCYSPARRLTCVVWRTTSFHRHKKREPTWKGCCQILLIHETVLPALSLTWVRLCKKLSALSECYKMLTKKLIWNNNQCHIRCEKSHIWVVCDHTYNMILTTANN